MDEARTLKLFKEVGEGLKRAIKTLQSELAKNPSFGSQVAVSVEVPVGRPNPGVVVAPFGSPMTKVTVELAVVEVV